MTDKIATYVALRGIGAIESGMDQPLWQLLLNITFVGLVARQAVVGVLLAQGQSALWISNVALCAACAVAAIAVWGQRRIVFVSLLLIAFMSTIEAVVELATGGPSSALWICFRLGVVLSAALALCVLAQRPRHDMTS